MSKKLMILGASLIALMVSVGLVTVLGGLSPALAKHQVLLGVLAGRHLLPKLHAFVSKKLNL